MKALLYGGGDFQRSLTIVNASGWDTRQDDQCVVRHDVAAADVFVVAIFCSMRCRVSHQSGSVACHSRTSSISRRIVQSAGMKRTPVSINAPMSDWTSAFASIAAITCAP